MSFVPHTGQDLDRMLSALGLDSPEDLFGPIPEDLRIVGLDPEKVPGPASEPEILQYMQELAGRNTGASLVCFAGGGAYDDYVPAVVEDLANRAEFKTSYTPYQPEVSQGVLQALFEYQSLVCRLTGMEVANASVYDGGSALTEAVNMARAITGRHSIVVSRGVNPRFLDVMVTLTRGSGLEVRMAALDDLATAFPIELAGGKVWEGGGEPAALVVQQPNYFGVLEDLGSAVDTAHGLGALAVVVTDPLSNGILKRPGEYGADIVVAEGQSLGNPLSFGGPYLGIVATREEYLRHLPGRISGMTLDADGRVCFALALQGREQHIRRAKASSNICTNQTLNAIAAAVYLSWLGPSGLAAAAERCCRLAHLLAERMAEVPGFELGTGRPFFREFPLRLPMPASEFLRAMEQRSISGGLALESDYPEIENTILIAVSTARRIKDVEKYSRAVRGIGK